ncbi:MAG: DUF2336 domain-containing protein [Parvibaculum sp.]
MTSFTHVRDLIELAKEPSSERRRELLRGVTDIFLETPAEYTDAEREHFSGIMGDVARSLETQVRVELARRLATVAEAPRELVNQLAHDEIDVAGPLIAQSLALDENDLLAIIYKQGNEHRNIVAARPDVNERISDALVDHGDDDVVHTLVNNESAQIGRKTFEKVADRASRNDLLQGPLLNRRELPADIMHEMFWSVSTKLKSIILEKSADLNPEFVDQMLQQAERKIMKTATKQPVDRSSAQMFIDRKVELRELSETLLVELVRANRIDELFCGFSRIAKIDMETTERIFADKTGEALAIACKAIRFDRSTFSTLTLLASPKTRRPLSETRELLDLYDTIAYDMAQRAMRFWRVRKEAASTAA